MGLWGSNPFWRSTFPHGAKVPLGGPNPLEGSTFGCKGPNTFWGSNPCGSKIQGPGLTAMPQASSGGPKSLQETKPCLCIPNTSWDQNTFWGPSLTYGVQIPFGGQAFCVGAKSPWCPKTLLKAKPCFWIPTTQWGQNSLGGQFLLVGQALLLDPNPFWKPSISRGTQTLYRTQIPCGAQPLPVGPKSLVDPKSP